MSAAVVRTFQITYEWGEKPYKRTGPTKRETIAINAPDMLDAYRQAQPEGRRRYTGSIWRVVECKEVQS
jgi:hypothetical protein